MPRQTVTTPDAGGEVNLRQLQAGAVMIPAGRDLDAQVGLFPPPLAIHTHVSVRKTQDSNIHDDNLQSRGRI